MIPLVAGGGFVPQSLIDSSELTDSTIVQNAKKGQKGNFFIQFSFSFLVSSFRRAPFSTTASLLLTSGRGAALGKSNARFAIPLLAIILTSELTAVQLAQLHRFEELILINRKPRGGFAMRKDVWRAVIEVGFIIFLFYSNLLMGEFERSGMGRKRGSLGNRRCFHRCQLGNCHGSCARRLYPF